MRLSTLIISSAFMLAGMSAALFIEGENMLVARADSDFLAEVEARAYDEELGLYARGGIISRPSIPRGRNRDGGPPQIRRTSSRDPLIRSRPSTRYQSSSINTAAYRNDRGSRRARFGTGNNRWS